jgi:hypothetical protein
MTQAGDCSSTFRLNQEFRPSQVARSAPAVQATFEAKAKKSKLPAVGDVLIAGGVTGTKSTSSAQFYDPATKKFTKTGSMTIDRAAPCGLSLLTSSTSNQPVLVAGGAQVTAKTKGAITLTMTVLSSAEEYDPTTGTFTALSNPMTQPRAGCTATQLDDGTILIAGGLDASGNPQNTAEIFDPAASPPTFTAVGNMSSPRAFHTATSLQVGATREVLITGGLTNNNPNSGQQGLTLKSAELYDPATKTFSPVASQMSDFRAFHTATLLNDGTVLIAGGDSDGFPGIAFGATAAADIFNPIASTLGATGSLAEPLLLQGATLLPNDGTVLITGGFDAAQIVIFNSGGIGAFFGTVAQGAEIYDPSLKTFSCIGGTTTITNQGTPLTVCAPVMKHTHAGHVAMALNDGTVLIAGGFGGSKATSNAKTTKVAEIYNPSSQTFTKVGSMKTGVALGEAAMILGPAS